MLTYEEKFAYNIHRLRLDSKLTQKDFAQKIGYSEKTVSKWECNGSVPNIATLYKIASLYGVSIDELFRDKCNYLLGIDGGGTKTDFVLSDENLNIVKRVQLAGCNPIDIGAEAAKDILKSGIYEVCDGVGFSNVTMFAGLAGGSSGSMKQELGEFFGNFGFKKFRNDSDTQNILSAAFGDDDGVIIIMGTGCCAISQHDGVKDRVCGWGYLFEEGASGYSIARDALAALFRYADGSGEYTSFADAVLKNYYDVQALLGSLYDGGKKFIAAFCPIVFECAENGDRVCMEIIRNNMNCAANVIKTAVAKVGKDKVNVYAAGSLSKVSVAMNYLKNALADDNTINLDILDKPPVDGALIYAKKLLSEVDE